MKGRNNTPSNLTGIKNYLTRMKVPYKVVFIAMGLLSSIWFLLRVIPKPSRAAYPCMRAAAPLMSSFVIYLISITSTAFLFKRAQHAMHKARYVLASLAVLAAILVIGIQSTSVKRPVYANTNSVHEANQPMGVAKGIFPGRVVWTHNPAATNENATNDYPNDGWFLDKNNNMQVIQSLVDKTILELTGTETLDVAWDSLFVYFNRNHEKGEVGYQEGEIVFIKANATSTYGIDNSTMEPKRNVYGIAETSPHVALAVIRHLVNVVGVPQDKIYIGDPMKIAYEHCKDLWESEFPDIHIIGSTTSGGREKAVKGTEPFIYYSDRGAILRTGTWDDATAGDPVEYDTYYTIFDEAEYIINIPTLKAHARAGVTMFAKNHFGSHTRSDAKHLHGGLVDPEMDGTPSRLGYGYYRVLVDIMGHEKIGGKTMLFLMDALFSGSEATDPPRKFQMYPFNGDWTSSIFASLDPVAIESVGFDILRTEFTESNPYASYPQMLGADDYLQQAADEANWPDGITYDPENDGTPIGSLGVHEHWNDAVNMQYSRNLGTGEGIELLYIKLTNNPPEVAAEIADVTLESVAENIVISDDLNTYFSDANEEDVLSFTASSENELISVTISENGELSVLADASFSGTATITVKASDGEFETSLSFDVNYTPVGINHFVQFDRSIHCYPNPVKDQLNIRIDNKMDGNFQLTLYSVDGKLINQDFVSKSSTGIVHRMNTANLKGGIYILEVQLGSHKTSKYIYK